METLNIQFEFILLSFEVLLHLLGEIQPNCPKTRA
jgi:hypothetical protein